jgi:hypothetical protein
MSTAPTAMTVQQFLDAAFKRLDEMLVPGCVLRPNSQHNRQLILGVCAELNIPSVTISPENINQAATNFRRAVVTLCNDPGRWHMLVWNKEPQSIQKFKPELADNPQKIAERQQDDINKEEARTVKAKEQTAAEARCLELIHAFYPTSYRGVEYRIMEEVKKTLTDHLAKHKKKGTCMLVVAKSIEEYIAKKYAEVERMKREITNDAR